MYPGIQPQLEQLSNCWKGYTQPTLLQQDVRKTTHSYTSNIRTQSLQETEVNFRRKLVLKKWRECLFSWLTNRVSKKGEKKKVAGGPEFSANAIGQAPHTPFRPGRGVTLSLRVTGTDRRSGMDKSLCPKPHKHLHSYRTPAASFSSECSAQEYFNAAWCCKIRCFTATYLCPLWKGHSRLSDRLLFLPEE